MRQLLIAILMVISGNAVAESPRVVVLRNECAKIDPNIGFKCIVRESGFEVRMVSDIRAMPEPRKKIAMGEFHRIVLRFYDLGGRQFIISADRWPPTKVNGCKITPTRTYRCSAHKCNADRSDCEPVYAPH